MDYLFLLLPALGCTLLMVACAAMMWGGAKMMNRRTGSATTPAEDAGEAAPSRAADATR